MNERDTLLRIMQIKKRIAQLPIGTVVYKKIKGKEQPYLQWAEGGKTKSKYIKMNEREEVLQRVAERKALAEEMKTLTADFTERFAVKEESISYAVTSRPGLAIRKLPIGVQSFESLRKDGYLYVDKTKYIYDLVHAGSQYFLSRPRRFGKSLFLSTLKAYWEGKKELFAGLDIVALEKDNPDAWQPYPVFYFDFNGKNYQADMALEEVLDEHLRGWEEVYGGDSAVSLEERFRKLLVRAKEKFGRNSVVLVDEYDKSLLETLHNPVLAEHNKAVFKGFFGTLKSFDEYLQFVFITGVTKFNKVSIFSDLNQLNDISMNARFAAVCGITESELKAVFMPEIRHMAVNNGISVEECLAKLQETYDGYHFHPRKEGVYNPFSLLNALYAEEFGAYWFATGTPSFLVKKLEETGFELNQFSDGTLCANGRELSDYRADNPDPVPLLYQTGYLTIAGYDAHTELYTLGFPNREVRYGFLENLMAAYVPVSSQRKGKDIASLNRCIEKGDIDGVRDIFTALFASIPYASVNNPAEYYFASVVYLTFVLLGKLVTCEVHSAKGRADCIVETKDYIYIFEFKLDRSADEALTQIEEKGYALPYAADARKLFKVGVKFDSRARNITEWKVA